MDEDPIYHEVECPACGGKGEVLVREGRDYPDGSWSMNRYRECRECWGDGKKEVIRVA